MNMLNPADRVEVILYEKGFELRAFLSTRNPISTMLHRKEGDLLQVTWVVSPGVASQHQAVDALSPPCVVVDGKVVIDVNSLAKSAGIRAQGDLLHRPHDSEELLVFAHGEIEGGMWRCLATRATLVAMVMAAHRFPVLPAIAGHFTDAFITKAEIVTT